MIVYCEVFYIDFFFYLVFGKLWMVYEWLFEVVMVFVYGVFGFMGFVIFIVFVLVVMFLIIGLWL